MDVLSVESCVQAVIGAYRDASKLVQRLKDKQKSSEEFILPEHLTKDFEDSLSLGSVAVQSQYDHDVRRFGETYARGDAIAREQMKDILIALQQSVISHLREVFMDEAALDLHLLKETSDDSRVNATVCLGQLYQRMSTATAAVKQISRPYLDEPNDVQLPPSLAYSSSRSTHSSFEGRPFDTQSASSFTTYSSRTAIGHNRKPSGGPTPQRKISMNSAFSYQGERDQPKSRTPGEDNVPALPFPMQGQTSQGAVKTASAGIGHSSQTENHVPSPNAAPPPYKPNSSIPVEVSDEKGQTFPRDSSFYQPLIPDLHQQLQGPPSRQRSPRDMNFSRPNPPVLVHELDNSPRNEEQPPPDQESAIQSPAESARQNRSQSPPISLPISISQQQAVPLNPDYSTLEYVATLDSRSRPPADVTVEQQYQQYLQQIHPRLQQPLQYSYQSQTVMQTQPVSTVSAVPRPHTSSATTTSIPAPMDPILQHRVPTIPSVSRPPSIRSTGSGSRINAFTLRKALPPGIAEAINKPAASPLEAQLNSQPRYVRQKPQPLDLSNNDPNSQVTSPTSPLAQQLDNLSDGVQSFSTADTVSLESTMRVPSSPHLQVTESQLNLPSESNLAGFCKGAVRQQLAARKKGFSLEHRKGAKGLEYFFRCTKCNFEGPAAVSTALPSGGRGAVKREKTFDMRVRASEGGIQYRWTFLAKSHVTNKSATSDASNSGDVFGCYFCCAEGVPKGWVDETLSAQLATLGTFGEKKAGNLNVMPTFHGLQTFLAHLETHRMPGRTPGLIVANEMNCIVGRVAQEHEDFDLNLPPVAE